MQRRSKLGAKELFKANTTISSLLEYFTDQYMQKGEAGLPVRMEDDDEDPVEESGEYYNRVISLYKAKPENYEDLLAKNMPFLRTPKRYRKETLEVLTTVEKITESQLMMTMMML